MIYEYMKTGEGLNGQTKSIQYLHTYIYIHLHTHRIHGTGIFTYSTFTINLSHSCRQICYFPWIHWDMYTSSTHTVSDILLFSTNHPGEVHHPVLKVKPRVTLGSVEELGRRPGAGAIFCAGPEKKRWEGFFEGHKYVYVYIYTDICIQYIMYIYMCVCRDVFNYFR